MLVLFLLTICALSLTISFYVFDLIFLKIIPKLLLWAFIVQSISVVFHNFKKKMAAHSLFLFIIHIHCQCLSQCKINLTQGKQHSKHPENGRKIARNSKARWKLFNKIETVQEQFKTDNSSFKGEKNRFD